MTIGQDQGNEEERPSKRMRTAPLTDGLDESENLVDSEPADSEVCGAARGPS